MNRRDFIKAGTGAFFFAAANRVFGAGTASNRVRLAIVGCREGCRGFSVMRAALKVPGVEIACVCDVDSRARAFAADYVQKATGLRPRMEKDLRKVLEDRLIDGIISEEPCTAGFDREGNLLTGFPRRLAKRDALAQGDLKALLRETLARTK